MTCFHQHICNITVVNKISRHLILLKYAGAAIIGLTVKHPWALLGINQVPKEAGRTQQHSECQEEPIHAHSKQHTRFPK